MATRTIEWREKCKSCKGTGIYVGFAEKDGYGVQCHTCKGTGVCNRQIEYEDFDGRVCRTDVHTVLCVNPGIGVGVTEELPRGTFGGKPYDLWLVNNTFYAGSEMRKHTCPCWWYQSADSSKKPHWDECGWGVRFPQCEHFAEKGKCWERWDREFGKEA